MSKDNDFILLHKRIEALSNKVDKLPDTLFKAFNYLHSDPHASLNKCRTVSEKILRIIFENEMGKKPLQGTLGYFLADKDFIGKLPRRVSARFNFIRDLCNIGSHGGEAYVEDAHTILKETLYLVEWFFENYDVTNVSKMDDVKEIEIFPELKKKYKELIRSDIASIKFVQDSITCYLEITNQDNSINIDDLDFFRSDEVYDSKGILIDILPDFNPKKDIHENINFLLNDFPEDALQYCDHLF